MIGPALVSGQMRYILVVESDASEGFALSMLLQRFGYTVANTSSAGAGVEFLCVAPAVAVIAEAGETGTDLMQRLKHDSRFRGIPLVMVTDRPDRGLEKRVESGELAGLLRSPLDPESVFLVIQKVIENGSRENIRIPTALPAELLLSSGPEKGYVTVLSQFGMFFRTLEPQPAKTVLPVRLTMGDRTIELRAEVLYTVTFEEGPFCEPGMGMKFIQVAAEDSALIKYYIYDQIGCGILPPGSSSGQA